MAEENKNIKGKINELAVLHTDAYALAVANGFKGTLVEWLNSLVGKSAYDLAVMHGFDGTEEEWVKVTDLAKETTLECSTKAQYYAGLADSAQKNAQTHETDARNWEREAFAHMQEVRNIVDTADEKLGLLANIPDDYITLDADVKSNTALIAGNKADIASNERAIAKNAENITRNSKRITNIEQGLTPDSFETDDSVAYQKDVPANALPYAAVQKVGGMTRKCANLAKLALGFEWGVSTSFANDGKITLTTTNAYQSQYAEVSRVSLKANTTYSLAMHACKNMSRAAIWRVGTTEPLVIAYPDHNPTYTPTQDIDVIIAVYPIDFSEVGTISGCYVMLNDGTTAQPYEPYFEGLRSAKVTEVKSVGANLFGGDVLADKLVEVYKATKDEISRTVMFDAAQTIGADLPFSSFKENTQYTFVIYGKNPTSRFGNLAIFYTDGTSTQFNFSSADKEEYIVAHSTAGKTVNFFCGVASGGSTILYYNECGIFEGVLTADDFKPYVTHTLPIPEAVRPANGINENVYDYIEWAEDGNRKKVVRCGVVDMGALDWIKNSTTNDGLSTVLYCNYSIWAQDSPVLCALFKQVASQVWENLKDGEMMMASGYLVLATKDYTDAASFKAAMSGVMLVYQLAEPIVTDISDLITADNLIGVEGGGTLTFENEYGYAVPSEVEYQVEV